VDLLYHAKDTLCKDKRLACWSKYIQEAGEIRGFPNVATKTGLVTALATIVFTASVQHAAVNYSQSKYYGYVQNSPAAIYYDLDQMSSWECRCGPSVLTA
jgi:arachidonate 15-lipoxygenase